MPTVRVSQTNFSSGEIDPLLLGRTDLPQYKNGLGSAQNVIIRPQGVVKNRPGSVYVDDCDLAYNQNDQSDGYKCRFVPFEFDTDNQYMLLFEDSVIRVYKNRALQTTVAHPYSIDDLPDLYTAQALDTLILAHEDFLPRRLIRNSDVSWTLETLTLTNIPRYAFELDYHNPTFTITPSAVEGNITITASGHTTDTGNAQAGSSNTITLKAASSFTADDQPNGMFVEITAGTGAGQTRHVEDYVASTKVATVYPDWDTAPDATSSYSITPFKVAAIGEYAEATNGFGRARYVEYVSSTVMKAVTEIPFFDTSGLAPNDWQSEHGWEEVWSPSRGYPRTCAFHQGRLYFGGSKTRPNTVWGSRVGSFFDFNQGSGLDDESVEATINTERFNKIVNLISAADLQIFTTGGEFVVRPATSDVLTPSNFQVTPQSAYGSEPGLRTIDINGSTVFMQRGGKSMMAFQYTDAAGQYKTQPLSVLFSHLLSTPRHMVIKRATRSDETDTVYVINEDYSAQYSGASFGNCTVLSLLPAQNVYAASTYSFLDYSVGVIGDDVYFMASASYRIAPATIPTTKYLVGCLDPDYLSDLAEEHTILPSDTYFPTINKYVAYGTSYAIAINPTSTIQPLRERYGPLPVSYQKIFTTTNPTTVEIDPAPFAFDSPGVLSRTVQIGKPFISTIRFLPLELPPESGGSQFSKKRVSEVTINGGPCGPFKFQISTGNTATTEDNYFFEGRSAYYYVPAFLYTPLTATMVAGYFSETGTFLRIRGLLGYDNPGNDVIMVIQTTEPYVNLNIRAIEAKLTFGS